MQPACATFAIFARHVRQVTGRMAPRRDLGACGVATNQLKLLPAMFPPARAVTAGAR